MTKAELRTALDEAGICPWSYSLDGDMPNDAYVLSHEPDGRWATYYELEKLLNYPTGYEEALIHTRKLACGSRRREGQDRASSD